MKIADVCHVIEDFAPLQLQEKYDNSGLQTGSKDWELKGVLIALDATEPVVEEARKKGANLIISHHPLIFKPVRHLAGSDHVTRTLSLAIKSDIALYSAHTNLDNVKDGVNAILAEKIGLKNLSILSPKSGNLLKLEFYVPTKNTSEILNSISKAGAGNIGNYSACSFIVDGKGFFTPNEFANPTIGQQGKTETVDEQKVEVIFPNHLKKNVLSALMENHPYEEVAYYILPTENLNQGTGSGIMGYLEEPMSPLDFLALVKQKLGLGLIRHSGIISQRINKVGICGGSGNFLINDAKSIGCDAFLTGDLKYHDFFEPDNRLLLADIGHFESEIHSVELMHRLLSQNFPNIALSISKSIINPVHYS